VAGALLTERDRPYGGGGENGDWRKIWGERPNRKMGEMKTGSSRFWFKRNAFSIFFNKMGLPHRKGPGRGWLNVPCLSSLLQHPTDTSASHSTPNIEMLKH